MTRLPSDKFTAPWHDAEPCPCGSGQYFSRCCKVDSWRLPRVATPELSPPLPATGHAHSGCYMSSTRDCSTKISREHYISEAILEEFPTLRIAGVPWHPDDKFVPYKPSSLTAKILCTRHNAAMSGLDAHALHSFRAFVEAPRYVTTRLTAGRAQHHLVSGDALQLWMLKVMAGLYFGGVAAHEGQPLKKSVGIDLEALTRALSGEGLDSGAGLYVTQGAGEMMRQTVQVMPYTDIASNRLAGLKVNFGTISFETFLSSPPADAVDRMKAARRYRPGVLDFNGPARDARIVLSWFDQGLSINRLGFEIANPPLEEDM